MIWTCLMKTVSQLLEETISQYAFYRGFQITHDGSENLSNDAISITKVTKKGINFYTPMSTSRLMQLKRLKVLQLKMDVAEEHLSSKISRINIDDAGDLDVVDEQLLQLRSDYNSIIASTKMILKQIMGEISAENPKLQSKLSLLLTDALKKLEEKTTIKNALILFILQSDNVLEEACGNEESKRDLLQASYNNSAYYPQQIQRLIKPAFTEDKVDIIQKPLIKLEIEKYQKKADKEINDNDDTLKLLVTQFFKETKESLFGKPPEPAPYDTINLYY
jgi:hypothetical protein